LLEDGGKARKPVSRWPVAVPFGLILTSGQQFGEHNTKIPYRFEFWAVGYIIIIILGSGLYHYY
jgi:hypothetical protein